MKPLLACWRWLIGQPPVSVRPVYWRRRRQYTVMPPTLARPWVRR